MSVLAIDPGNKESAYVLWDGAIVVGFDKIPNDDLLKYLVKNPHADHLAIEMVQAMGMTVGREVFETVWWIGRFCQAWPGEFTRISRMQVKMHLCGHPRAKDGNIRQAIIDKLGAPGTKKSPGPTYGISGDVWQALGVALTWEATRAELVAGPSH